MLCAAQCSHPHSSPALFGLTPDPFCCCAPKTLTPLPLCACLKLQNRSFMMEYDIHTLLDALTLCATTAVIYALTLTPIKNTYQSDLDSVRWYYVVSSVA